ncbi:hypothetical protein D3C71_1145820 [compost metagenome]
MVADGRRQSLQRIAGVLQRTVGNGHARLRGEDHTDQGAVFDPVAQGHGPGDAGRGLGRLHQLQLRRCFGGQRGGQVVMHLEAREDLVGAFKFLHGLRPVVADAFDAAQVGADHRGGHHVATAPHGHPGQAQVADRALQVVLLHARHAAPVVRIAQQFLLVAAAVGGHQHVQRICVVLLRIAVTGLAQCDRPQAHHGLGADLARHLHASGQAAGEQGLGGVHASAAILQLALAHQHRRRVTGAGRRGQDLFARRFQLPRVQLGVDALQAFLHGRWGGGVGWRAMDPAQPGVGRHGHGLQGGVALRFHAGIGLAVERAQPNPPVRADVFSTRHDQPTRATAFEHRLQVGLAQSRVGTAVALLQRCAQVQGLLGRRDLQGRPAQSVGGILHRAQAYPAVFRARGLHGHRQHGGPLFHRAGLRRGGFQRVPHEPGNGHANGHQAQHACRGTTVAAVPGR